MKTLSFLAALFIPAISSVEAGAPDKASYTVHEWGTFTSLQAADGHPMRWNPLTAAELPQFVYGLGDPDGKARDAGFGRVFLKTDLTALQRMETPVIYFYSGEPREVDVSVKMPQGLMTEWYPHADLPKTNRMTSVDHGHGELRWDHVQILARDDSSPLLRDPSGSHYYAARETAANPLRVPGVDGKSEVEKFLFYRGVGNFAAPMNVQMSADGARLTVRNDATEELGHAFVYSLSGGTGFVHALGRMPGGATSTLVLPDVEKRQPLARIKESLARQLKSALVSEGLYEKEAAAMVKTWDDSWFTEPGTRVFYTLPRAWTDRTLPLRLTPAPAKIARVMVGRAELITPATEFSLRREARRYVDGPDPVRANAVARVRALRLGRFLAPAMNQLVVRDSKDTEYNKRCWELVAEAGKKSDEQGVASGEYSLLERGLSSPH